MFKQRLPPLAPSLLSRSLSCASSLTNRTRRRMRHKVPLGIVGAYKASGIASLQGVARALRARGVQTARGGEWTARQVANMLERTDPFVVAARGGSDGSTKLSAPFPAGAKVVKNGSVPPPFIGHPPFMVMGTDGWTGIPVERVALISENTPAFNFDN